MMHIDPTKLSLPLPQAAKMELTIPTVYANIGLIG